jgi:hypothetical protein
MTDLKTRILTALPAARTDSHNYRTPGTAGHAEITTGAALIVSLLNVIGGNHTIAQAHQAIRELNREGRVRIWPESAQWELTNLDREYALQVGGQAKHWIAAA